MNPAQDLERTLRLEIDAHDRLIELKQKEQKAIVAGHPEEIEAALVEVEITALEVADLEESRKKATDEIAGSFGLEPDRVRLRDLLPLLSEDLASRLEELGRQLRQRLQTLQRLNEDSAFVVRHSLGWIDQVIRGALGKPAGTLVYDTGGVCAETEEPPLLVNRQV